MTDHGYMVRVEGNKVTIRPLTHPGQELDSIIERFMDEVWPAVQAPVGP